MYHYWVEGADGMHESENATVVTSLSSHAAITYDMKNLGTGQMSSHVQLLRPELNCLQQGEAALTEALLVHHLIPPPKTGLLRQKKHHSEVLQDQFLDEFIFKGEVKVLYFTLLYFTLLY